MNAPAITHQTNDAPQSRRLGSIAKSSSAPKTSTSNDALIKRFELQNAARRLLPTERVSNCLRSIVPNESNVQIMHDASKQRAYYAHLRTCDNVWHCPVCAAKITERRRQQLQKAVTYAHSELCLVPVLLTFTLSHSHDDALRDVLKTLKSAYQSMMSGRWYHEFKETFGLVGFVRATEVTRGANGWHPHLHVLAFFQPMSKDDYGAMKFLIESRWLYMVGKHGGTAMQGVGCDIRDANTAIYDYIAKFGHEPTTPQWGLESELAKAASKTASKHGDTPFNLLEKYNAGDAHAGNLFVEYAHTFKRTHQLEWSKGLKTLLLVDGDGDEAATDEHAILAELSRHEWYEFLSIARDLRGKLLAIASTGDSAAVKHAIAFALKFGGLPTERRRRVDVVPFAPPLPRHAPENPFQWLARRNARLAAINRLNRQMDEQHACFQERRE